MENLKSNALNKRNNPLKSGFFLELLEKAISDIPARSQEIIKSRFGITEGGAKTLEEIGREHKITRERVRQIIKEAFRKIKSKEKNEILKQAEKKIEFTINQNSGIMKEEDLLNKLGENNAKERNAARLFLECLNNIKSKEIKGELVKSCHTEDFDFSEWKNIKNSIKEILEKEKSVMENDDLYEAFLKKYSGIDIDKEKIFNFLAVSQEIKKNNFGKWGIAGWIDVNPRVAWQRAYVILKEIGRPLHFRKIAELIDRYNLNKRKTHPQTIHNELIKNTHFVLVGRGVYALSEWGYKSGTVKDVLEDILKENKKPMERNEILSEILKRRQVKKSTILINLNNFFIRVDKDKYAIKK